MRRLALALFGGILLSACGEQAAPPPKPKPAAERAPGDARAGQKLAQAECQSCHGQDGGAVAPGIPHLAGQRESYLLASLHAYKEGKRRHAALKVIAEHMSEADMRNVSAYYASLPGLGIAAGGGGAQSSPYERGKARAADCVQCHGADGNSTRPGLPNLAGQPARYLILALQEYARGERKVSATHEAMRALKPADMEAVALYFASQTPAARTAPESSDPAAGAALSAVCSGCHGAHGVGIDSTIPNLASQDFSYLVEAIKAYRTTRKREKMRLYITGLSDGDIRNLAAFYTQQKSRRESANPGARPDRQVRPLPRRRRGPPGDAGAQDRRSGSRLPRHGAARVPGRPPREHDHAQDEHAVRRLGHRGDRVALRRADGEVAASAPGRQGWR
jgi:cytochrome c553